MSSCSRRWRHSVGVAGAAACIGLVACGTDGEQPSSDRTDSGAGGGAGIAGHDGAGGAPRANGGSSATTGGSAGRGAGGVNGAGGSVAPASGGVGGSGGTAPGTGGSGGAPTVVSGLPVPPGPGNQPAPSGSTANLAVLPWAGFRSAVTYTFDDSSPSQVDHWPDIAAAGVPVTFYITTSNDWYAGSEAAWKAALAAGHELGNHTVHHCNFDAACNGASAGSGASEIDDASAYIEDTLGQAGVWTLAYPFGDTGYRALAEERFFVARGVGGGTIAPGDDTDPWNLPVFGAQGGETEAVLDGAIDGARSDGEWLVFLFHSLAPNSEAWYAPVEIANVTGSMGHAKALGDVWIDTLANVAAYWLGQKLVEGATPGSSGSATTWTWTLPNNFPPARYVRVTVDGGTLTQGSAALAWHGQGYYEVALDAGSLTWAN